MVKIKDSKSGKTSNPKSDDTTEDRISLMPEEILLRIFSFLTLREVVGTSLVSKRFSNLWMRITCLTFSSSSLYGQEFTHREHFLRMNDFIARVDWILNRLLSPSLSIFYVQYEISQAAVRHINRWVSFALEHDVESLHLHLRKGGIVDSWFFPPCMDFMRRVPNLNSLHLGGCIVISSLGCFKNLRSVSLTFVVITDDLFDDLLLNCALLEELYVNSAKILSRVRIPKSLVRLRFLSLYLCDNLEIVEVNAMNLVSFLYHGAKTDFSFNNVSNLKMLRMGWLDYVSCHLLSQNSLLHTLILDLHLFPENFDTDFRFLPTLTSLKVLILSVASLMSGFLEFINLLRATPSLSKFGLHLKYSDYTSISTFSKATEKFHHKHLKEIEITGFSGKEAHMDLVFFLIETAIALEKITLRFSISELDFDIQETRQLDEFKACGERISGKLPPGVKLEILRCH